MYCDVVTWQEIKNMTWDSANEWRTKGNDDKRKGRGRNREKGKRKK